MTIGKQVHCTLYLKEVDTFSREATVKIVLSTSEKRIYSKSKEFAPLGENSFPFECITVLRGFSCSKITKKLKEMAIFIANSSSELCNL